MKIVAALVAGLAVSSAAQAQIVTLTALLTGGQENPPVSTPATGTAEVRIDLSNNSWSVNLSFGTLTAPVTVAHIHRAPLGSNGPVIIGLDGMALSGGRPTWNLISPGITSFNSGGFVNAPFAFPATEVANLLAGNTYFNIHSSAFPSGEIRGQIVPTPAGAMALLGAAGLFAGRRRR